MKCTHPMWYSWRSNADQFGEVKPDAQGRTYWYKRECAMMGCRVWQFAENLAPVGDVKEVEGDGRTYPTG